jgi:hypothetical protein
VIRATKGVPRPGGERELEEEDAEPKRIRRLTEWVDRLEEVLREAAKRVGANGFSISVAVPFSVGSRPNGRWNRRPVADGRESA